MRCIRCEALKADLAAAREEIAAWEAYAEGRPMPATGIDHVADRQELWKTIIPKGAAGGRGLAARALMALCDAPGRVITPWGLILTTRSSGTREAEDINPKMAGVIICALRNTLRGHGQAGRLPAEFASRGAGVCSHWGRGYSIAPDAVRAIKALVGEVAK